MNLRILLTVWILLLVTTISAQKFTKDDTLMGSNTAGRSWWDVQRYDLTVRPDYGTKTIQGKVDVRYKVTGEKSPGYMQLDLQKPLEVDSLYYNGKIYINNPANPFYREGNHLFIPLPKAPTGATPTLTVVYH